MNIIGATSTSGIGGRADAVCPESAAFAECTEPLVSAPQQTSASDQCFRVFVCVRSCVCVFVCVCAIVHCVHMLPLLRTILWHRPTSCSWSVMCLCVTSYVSVCHIIMYQMFVVRRTIAVRDTWRRLMTRRARWAKCAAGVEPCARNCTCATGGCVSAPTPPSIRVRKHSCSPPPPLPQAPIPHTCMTELSSGPGTITTVRHSVWQRSARA